MKRQESTIVPPDEEKPQVTTHIHTKDFRSMTDRAVTENPDTGEPIIYPEAKRMLIDELFNKDGKINHKDKPWEKLSSRCKSYAHAQVLALTPIIQVWFIEPVLV